MIEVRYFSDSPFQRGSGVSPLVKDGIFRFPTSAEDGASPFQRKPEEQAMNAKRNLQDDLRGTYAKSWTVSIDQNGKRIVHVHYHEKPQTKKMTIES